MVGFETSRIGTGALPRRNGRELLATGVHKVCAHRCSLSRFWRTLKMVHHSVSSYWQQIQQLIRLRLQGCRRRHLLKGGTGLIRFQAVGHTRAAG